MKRKIKLLIFLILLFFVHTNVLAEETPNITYTSHAEGYGWLRNVGNDQITGTTGESKRLEALRIDVSGGGIKYRAHVQDIGWMNYVTSGHIMGTTGQSKRLEAIQIELTGTLKEKYDIYYRAHVQDIGWMDYVKNGEIGGTTGQSKRMEALQIKLVPKEDIEEPEEQILDLNYKSYINGGNWQDYVNNGELSGTTGEAKSIKYMNIKLTNTTNVKGSINYSIYNTYSGWNNYVESGTDVGKDNENIEAIKIKLTDELATKYDIYYRVHVGSVGWLDWAKNDDIAGTTGYCYPIEAIEIKLVEKGTETINTSGKKYMNSNNKITYTSHVSDFGWLSYVNNGETSGTTGISKRMEALKIKFETATNSKISYSTYVANRGWTSYVGSDELSGTTGLSRRLEAIKIKLNGNLANYYDIYYRVHVSDIGWMDWAKNDEKAGSVGNDTQIEAIQIKLVKKNETFTESTTRPYVIGSFYGNKYYDAFGRKATGFKYIDGVKYYFDGDGDLIVTNAKKVIDVSSWQDDIDWDTIKKNEDVDEAIIRVGWGVSYDYEECGFDSRFDRNIKAVQRLGIPYSIYIYAYAESNSTAEKEANWVMSKMQQYNIPKSTYVWYDAEIYSISRDTYNSVIPTFINKMKSGGYNNIGIYGGVRQLDTASGNLNTTTLRNYPIWVSQYYKKIQYTGPFIGWQFSSEEFIDGINGHVDVSVFR